MIVTRTPLRVSFLGGGSDYESFYKSNTGYVLGTTINQYVYVSLLALPEFAEEKYRFTYRITESVQKISDFVHPVVKSSLIAKNWSKPINLATMSDLPGRSGLGSSSSFTVGLELALAEFGNEKIEPRELAMRAVQIERRELAEAGGLQDQYQAAVGGFKLYEFKSSQIGYSDSLNGEFLSNSMVLVPMNDWRDSHNFAESTNNVIQTKEGNKIVSDLANLASNTFNELETTSSSEQKLRILSTAMNYGWEKKVELSGGTISPQVMEVVDAGKAKGALAGRLCGAGGSGFVLFLTDPDMRDSLVESFHAQRAFPIEPSESGSELLLTGDSEISND